MRFLATLLLVFFAYALLIYGAVHNVDVGGDDGFSFAPDNLTVAVGDSVIFNKTNTGFHNIHESNGLFFCSTICAAPGTNKCPTTKGCEPTSTTWIQAVHFTQAGTFKYQCDAHFRFGMVGVINVVTPIAL